MIADARAGNKYGLDSVSKAPKVEERFAHYKQAYEELGTERQHGMSLGPIPHKAIRAWCEEHEFDPLEAEAFHYVIRTVDNHERAATQQKQQEEQDRIKNKKR